MGSLRFNLSCDNPFNYINDDDEIASRLNTISYPLKHFANHVVLYSIIYNEISRFDFFIRERTRNDTLYGIFRP